MSLPSHTEHLNTPRLVADASGTAVWKWDQAEPFAATTPDEDPDGNSVAFDLPLRLSGQYFDKETGLHQNHFRDYSANLGRYVESDLIGLKGGLNTFIYPPNPVSNFDPYGLLGTGSGASSAKYAPRTQSACGSGFSFPAFSFQEACVQHDNCYGTCGANRYVCDAKFQFDLMGSCRPNDWLCKAIATAYHSAVIVAGGGAYDSAQNAACSTSCKSSGPFPAPFYASAPRFSQW